MVFYISQLWLIALCPTLQVKGCWFKLYHAQCFIAQITAPAPHHPPKECLNTTKHNTNPQHKSQASCRSRSNSFTQILCVGSVAHLRIDFP